MHRSFTPPPKVENIYNKPPLITAEQKLGRSVLSMIFEDEFNSNVVNYWCPKHIQNIICPIADIEFEAFLRHFKTFKESVNDGSSPQTLIKIINECFLNITKANSLNASNSTKKRNTPNKYKAKKSSKK